MNICVDRMVKEIVDDELEYKKYKLSGKLRRYMTHYYQIYIINIILRENVLKIVVQSIIL